MYFVTEKMRFSGNVPLASHGLEVPPVLEDEPQQNIYNLHRMLEWLSGFAGG